MAHFAKLDPNNVVLEIVVVNNSVLTNDNSIEDENIGIEYLKNLTGHEKWKQTSYNAKFRGSFAGMNFIYDEENDIFVPPTMSDKWVFDEAEQGYKPAVPIPQDDPGENFYYRWDIDSGSWIKEEITTNE